MFSGPPKGLVDLGIRLIIVLVCAALGGIIPSALYAADKEMPFMDFYPYMMIAGLIATAAISCAKFFARSTSRQTGWGCLSLSGYSSLFVVLVIGIASEGTDSLDELYMWWPIMLLFGIPMAILFLAPVVLMAIVASNTIFDYPENETS